MEPLLKKVPRGSIITDDNCHRRWCHDPSQTFSFQSSMQKSRSCCKRTHLAETHCFLQLRRCALPSGSRHAFQLPQQQQEHRMWPLFRRWLSPPLLLLVLLAVLQCTSAFGHSSSPARKLLAASSARGRPEFPTVTNLRDILAGLDESSGPKAVEVTVHSDDSQRAAIVVSSTGLLLSFAACLLALPDS